MNSTGRHNDIFGLEENGGTWFVTFTDKFHFGKKNNRVTNLLLAYFNSLMISIEYLFIVFSENIGEHLIASIR